jgi:hypothetical protein
MLRGDVLVVAATVTAAAMVDALRVMRLATVPLGVA